MATNNINFQNDLSKFLDYLKIEKDPYKRSHACYELRIKYPTSYVNCKCNCCSCFDGECIVSMKNGTYKKIKDLQRGDTLSNNANIVCKVVYKSDCEIELVRYQNLLITPYHPIVVDDNWVFPKDVSSDDYDYKNIVYNFVLDSQHIMVVEGIECVTLGHNFKGDVIEHPYFGSDKVINDLKKDIGWENGEINYYNIHYKRDENGLVCGIF